jgi:DNA helicase IV
MELAARLLPTAAPQQTPPTAVREGDAEPRIIKTSREQLFAAVAKEARTLVAELATGRVGIVCPDNLVDALSSSLESNGVKFGRAGASALEATLTLVPVSLVKGLEMDGVVVVEPTDIYDSVDAGPRGLYVALTRSTQRLVVVHSRELPVELRD